MHTKAATGTIVPVLRYRDLPAAIDWLCTAFGLRTHGVERDAQGAVRHAQLTFGDGMVMLGSIQEPAAVQPGAMAGYETQICYVCVRDVQALRARARAAGATPLLETGKPGRAGRPGRLGRADGTYSFRDPGGHIWQFGSNDPWRGRPPSRPPQGRRRGVLRTGAEAAALLAGLTAFAIASTTPFGWAYQAAGDFVSLTFAGSPASGQIRALRVEPAQDAGASDLADGWADGREVAEALARERDGRMAAERAARVASAALAAAELAARRAHEQLGAAERAADEARRAALTEQSARQAAEQTLEAARQELGRERNAREAAERATREALTRKPKAWRPKKVESYWTW